MISVLPSKDKEAIKELFKKYSTDFDEFSGCVIAEDGCKQLGFCLYSLNKESMTIHVLKPEDDLSLADGILRSAIHNAVFAKVIKVSYSEKAPEDVFRKLDFILNEEEKMLNVSKLYKSCCSCKDKNT